MGKVIVRGLNIVVNPLIAIKINSLSSISSFQCSTGVNSPPQRTSLLRIMKEIFSAAV